MALLGTSNRSQQLDKLASRLPFENQQQAAQQQQAATTQLQQAVAQQPASAGPQQAQQMGAQAAAQQGQIQVQASQQAQNQQAQATQLQMQERSRQAADALNQLQRGLTSKERQLQKSINQLGRQYKNELFDKQLQFSKDELGRTQWQERQLADYALMKARSAEDLRDYEQKVRQFSQRRMKMLEVSLAKVKNALEQESQKNEQELNQGLKKRLGIAKVQLEQKIARERAEAANRGSMLSVGLGVVGAVVAGYFTGGAGAPVGYAAGSAIGTAAAGATAPQE